MIRVVKGTDLLDHPALRQPDFPGAYVDQYHGPTLDRLWEKHHAPHRERVFPGWSTPQDPALLRTIQVAYMPEDRRLYWSGTITHRPKRRDLLRLWYRPRRAGQLLAYRYPTETRIHDGLLSRELWLREAAKHHVNLVLPAGGLPLRALELLALGVPFIACRFELHRIAMAYPLPEAGVHYIAVDTPTAPDWPRLQCDEPTDPEHFATEIMKAYQRIVDDVDGLRTMSARQMAWYDTYVAPSAVARQIIKAVRIWQGQNDVLSTRKTAPLTRQYERG